MISKKLWDVLDPGLVDDDDEEGFMDAAARERDQEALAQIGMHVASQHLDGVMKAASAKAAWDALKRMFRGAKWKRLRHASTRCKGLGLTTRRRCRP
jgi:hypothetical protein